MTEGMKWFAVPINFTQNPSIQQLADLLGIDCPRAGWIVWRLWEWTAQYAPLGVIPAPFLKAATIYAAQDLDREKVSAALSMAEILDIQHPNGVDADQLATIGDTKVRAWNDQNATSWQAACDKKTYNRERIKEIRKNVVTTSRQHRNNSRTTPVSVSVIGGVGAELFPEIVTARAKKPPKPPNPETTATVELMIRAFEVKVKGEYLPKPQDYVAVKKLLGHFTQQHIVEMWIFGLNERGYLHIADIAGLYRTFNRLTEAYAKSPKTGPRAPIGIVGAPTGLQTDQAVINEIWPLTGQLQVNPNASKQPSKESNQPTKENRNSTQGISNSENSAHNEEATKQVSATSDANRRSAGGSQAHPQGQKIGGQGHG